MANNYTTINEHLRSLSESTLNSICSAYLTPIEADLVLLIFRGRKNIEIAELLGIAPCEVIRRKRVVSKKIRTIWIYHHKLDYITFLREANRVLPEDQFKALAIFIVELKSFKDISEILGVRVSVAFRLVKATKPILERKLGNIPEFAEFLKCFEDIPYLNLKEIRRSADDVRKFKRLQIGRNTLQEWISNKVVTHPERDSGVFYLTSPD